MRELEARLDPGDPAWARLDGLLQAGVALSAPAGLSLRAFMREVLGFPDDYIEGTVSTVFLDGKPVDDIDAARIEEGSLVALSAAMPGLVGAVMRRNSPYASFREAITWIGTRGESEAAAGQACRLRLRLFNSVMRDRGPEILARGVMLEAGEAGRILAGEAEGIAGGDADDGLVLLRIRPRD